MSKKDGKPGKAGGFPLGVLVGLGVLDVLCLAVLVFCLAASPASAAVVAVETPAAFEENADLYGEYDLSETYAAAGMVQYVSPTPPETTAPPTTAAPTTAQAQPGTSTSANDPYAGFIFPNSNTEYITVEQIDAYANTKDTCQRAVSELFARYGYEFGNADTLAFFNQYEWYAGMEKRHDQDAIISGFNSVERANFDTLRAYEDAHGWG